MESQSERGPAVTRPMAAPARIAKLKKPGISLLVLVAHQRTLMVDNTNQWSVKNSCREEQRRLATA